MNSYDASLPTDADWVRFLLQDTLDPPVFADDEIDAFVTAAIQHYGPGAWVKYVVAADLLDLLALR